MNCNRRILKSSNTNKTAKTTWNIISLDTDANFSNGDIQVLIIEGKPSYYKQAITEGFNNYFLFIADSCQV